MKNEKIKVATIKMTRYFNVLVKGSKEQLERDYMDIDPYDDFSDESIKSWIECNVGENNVYMEEYLPEYEFSVHCDKYVDQEWFNNGNAVEENHEEEHRRLIAEESGWFDNHKKEAA